MALFKRACFWLTDVDYIDYVYKDLRKRQLFTHPDKIDNSSVADHWPADDLMDSAKFMSSEMNYLKLLREKILDAAEETARTGTGPSNATPAGGTGPSASSSSAAVGTKGQNRKGHLQISVDSNRGHRHLSQEEASQHNQVLALSQRRLRQRGDHLELLASHLRLHHRR
eukprot:3250743-Amphidinium_carterae.2